MTIVTDLLLAVAILAKAAHKTLPENVTFDAVINDGTVASQKYIRVNSYRSAKDKELMPIAPDDPELSFTTVVSGYTKDTLEIFNRYSAQLAETAYYIVVYDKPEDVPANKECVHEKRDSSSLPYTEKELVDCKLDNETFGVERIWGNRTRLWANSKMRARLNTFFMSAMQQALTRGKLASGAKPRFIIDPPTACNELIFGTMGEEGILRVPVVGEMTSGEADNSFVEYLSDSYGRSFLIISADGDWQLNGLAELDKRRLLYPNKPLPLVWFDRTVDTNTRKNPELPMRYLNLTALYMYISGMDNIVPSECTVAVDDARVLSTIAMYMFGGTDYVAKFCKIGKFATPPTIYGPGALTGQSVASSKKKKKKEEKEEKKPRKSKKKDISVFLKPEYVQCFAIEVTDDGRVVPTIRHVQLASYLRSRYGKPNEEETPKEFNDLLNELMQEMARLQWALMYAYGYNDSTLPPRVRCLERISVASVPHWGWELEEVIVTNPDDMDKYANDRKMIVLEMDNPLRQHLLVDPNIPATLFRVIRI
jgi:hypothetical protein